MAHSGGRLRSVPGVANVVTYGGFVKQYQVLVSPHKLRSYGLHLANVETALRENNANVGGNFIERAGQEVIIRGIARIQSVETSFWRLITERPLPFKM